MASLCGLALCGAAPTASDAAAGPVIHPLRSTNPAAVEAGKRRARFGAALSSPMSALTAPSGSKAVVSGSLNQPGLSATDNASRNDGTPPDPTGAAGPSNYVEFVNSVVRVYTKDLATVATQQLDTFAGHTNDAVFDPQIQWDPQANRWFYLADDCAASSCATQNYLAYGWSKTADPSNLAGGWCNFQLEVDNQGGVGLFDDYPKLGHNNTHLIFGTNVFDAAGNFVSARVWTVPKPASSATTCPGTAPTAHYWSGPASAPVEDAPVLLASPLENQDGTQAGTPVPADTVDSSANGYVVAAHGPANTSPAGAAIMTWHVDSSGALVADGDIAVTPYDVPAPVPQPGTSDVLDSSDTRLTQAVAHADPDASGAEAVWTQHTINGPGGRSVDRWYELLPASRTRRQEGNISDPTNFVFNGAISPTMSGNDAVIEYNVGGDNQLAQIWASSRKPAQPLSVMTSPVKLGDSPHFDQDFSCPSANVPPTQSCRWGDYAAATPDPAAATGQPDGPEHRVWGTNQLLDDPRAADPTAPHWTTRNFAIVPDRLPPVASFTASPATTTRGATVTFDGSASGDSEYPGGIASYAWDFDGDGTTDQTTTTPTVTHSYSALGTFNARLVVTDSDDGLQSQPVTQAVTVQNVPPVAVLSATPQPATRGAPVALSAAGSNDPDGSISDYRWDLDGNGSFETDTGTTPSARRTFANTGSFTVGLQVTDSDGATAVTTKVIGVVPPPMKLVLNAPKNVRLAALLAHGIRGKAQCGRDCTVKVRLTLPRRVARTIHLRPLIGYVPVRIRNGGKKAFKIGLTRNARRALQRVRPRTLTVTVGGTAVASGSRPSTAKRVLRVRS